jgi:two-component system response regulator FixJ
MNNQQTVFIVDDDKDVREGLELLLRTIDQECKSYSSAIEFLEKYDPNAGGCLVLDIRMPRMTGLDLQDELKRRGSALPIIFITGHGDIPMAVEAMRRGALDFIRKPFREHDLLDRINEALECNASSQSQILNKQKVLDKIDSLTAREAEVFERVAKGQMNKVIGFDLDISERTVEVHRSQVMKKMGVRTLSQLVRSKIESELI